MDFRPARRMRVTIRDVAREAEVSVATVSRVLNESGPVSPGTRQRVREVAGRLRYSPSSAARSLITSRSATLGVLLPDLYGDFFSEVIRGIDQAAQQSGFHLLVSGSHNARSEIEASLRAMRGRVDGLIVMSPEIDAHTLVTNLPEHLPVVLLDCWVEGDAFDSVNIDNFGGAYAMVQHLAGLGHVRIATITGDPRNHDAAERRRGYRAALGDAGLEWSERWEVSGDFTESGGYQAALALLARGELPTAIFAANDSMAIGALSAFRDAGHKVPDDIALAGFDDIPLARYVHPSLSSVHINISELGALATTMLLHAVSDQNQHIRRQVTLPTSIVVRASCGAMVGATGST
jgi:LacI family transcriptional regulator, galactose operon repressor